MGGTLQFLGDWGHIICAGLFAGLTIWVSRRFATQMVGKLLVAALSLTCIWSLSIAFSGVHQLETGVAESLRNCGWLVCLYLFPRQFGAPGARHINGALPLYVVLVLLLVAQCGLDILASLSVSGGAELAALAESAVILRLLWAIGALFLIERVFSASDAQTRTVVAPVATALAAMWSYDLVLYASALAGEGGMVSLLFALRGCVVGSLAPVIALVMRTGGNAVVMPSRALAWRGLGAATGLTAIILLVPALLALEYISTPLLRAFATGGLFMLVVGSLLVLPATRFHAQLKALAVKHLFRHRYDYREQWMRFVDTIGRSENSAGGKDGPLHRRFIKAMADITESSGGALLTPDEQGRLLWHSAWNWKGEPLPALSFDTTILERMRHRAWVIDIAAARASDDPTVPEALKRDPSAWALVPLVHFDELVGAVLLSRPPLMRPLDWEDFDMLRAAGRQVASYMAEARGQQALAEAQRFDEFNRRFAFIMHDIKNLVSQIGLVARNAERHAENPEFRADMILTLKDCAERMNTLLVRLSQHSSSSSEPEAALFALGDAVNAVVARRGGRHPLLVEGDLSLAVTADRSRIEQIVGHLVQNAIEASEGSGAPVVVRIERAGGEAHIAVIDHGCGMNLEFIRDELFRPFASTKQGGFGIGAYEARAIARSLGGSLAVESEEGRGSRFLLRLPLDNPVCDVAGGPADEERAA